MSNDDPLKKKSQKGKHKNDIGKNNKKKTKIKRRKTAVMLSIYFYLNHK